MKRKVLCIALALLMCLTVTLSAFADDSAETPPVRADISFMYGLTNVSGSTYRMWAKVINLDTVSVTAKLILYNGVYIPIASVTTTSSDIIINLSKDVSLTSGTYYLRLRVTADGTTTSVQKKYSI